MGVRRFLHTPKNQWPHHRLVDSKPNKLGYNAVF